MPATKTSAASKLRTMMTCAIIDALDWPRNNDSYDRAKSILDRLDPLTSNLCRKILDAVDETE
jgi:hypothetical protein